MLFIPTIEKRGNTAAVLLDNPRAVSDGLDAVAQYSADLVPEDSLEGSEDSPNNARASSGTFENWKRRLTRPDNLNPRFESEADNHLLA